jgi:ubiquinone/menaquinone biosynthesis C-methylase UbiE
MRQDLYQELFQVEDSHWWHQHKRRLIHQFINKLFTNPGKVLDLGAGTGKILSELESKDWQVQGIDSSPQAIKWSKKRGVKLKLADSAKQPLPFPPNYFDLILVLDFLEHLQSESKTLSNINKVLKPSGYLIITVPANPRLYSYWDKMLGHYRRYDKITLQKILKDHDFKVKQITYFFSFSLIPAILVRTIKKIFNQKQGSDFQTTPIACLSIPVLKCLASIERTLLNFIKLPFGLSILCLAQKK